MINPTNEDIGRSVNYFVPSPSGIVGFPQEGVITSFNDRYVFIRYGADKTGKATRREDLEWVSK